MTYNIRYDNPNDGKNSWENRKENVHNLIAFYEPHVLGIQEGMKNQVAYLDDRLSTYKYVGVGRDDGKEKGEFCAIFYNSKKFKILKSSTFWLSDTPNKISIGWDAALERICTYALLKDKKTQQKLWVFNTHFDHLGKKARIKSAKLLINKMKTLNKNKLPLILMGDLNSLPDEKPIRYLSSILNDTKKVCLSSPFGPSGTYNAFDSTKSIEDRIDYIFSSRDVVTKKYAVLSSIIKQNYLSDHFPVLVEIELDKFKE